ncbi:RNA polymerase II holoenzyme cyclin-like subunit [Cytospora mali]|uniref:RNA polymerase II holoenzyme cyclin-like subunit n=1 Tax=Cytospora mali TaxID=578113 RepID=A0A194VFN4_CYTMA|nr:RNA polymerase II holoenzyme cyclin-like subunit [Valsa mali var. pyri (nom. inval.)]
MAANYWESTQRKNWQFTKEQLASMRQKLEDEDPTLQNFGLPQLPHLNIFFNQQINRLGKRLGVRQQAMATAQVYIKRFYTKVDIRRTNPFLVITTALYLACKMEECPQHIRLMNQEARSLWTDMQLFHDPSKIGECEFWLISEMSSNLIVHQPYRTLTSLQSNLNLTQDEMALSWSIINDHYMTDLPLIYPPHTIALMAILLAIVFRPSQNANQGSAAQAAGSAMAQPSMAGINAVTAALAQAQARQPPTPGAPPGQTPADGVSAAQSAAMTKEKCERYAKMQRFGLWLAESNIDIEAMVDCTQELISFYDFQEQYNDKLTREQIVRFIKAKGLDKG